jgi:hypothetical protein
MISLGNVGILGGIIDVLNIRMNVDVFSFSKHKTPNIQDPNGLARCN